MVSIKWNDSFIPKIIGDNQVNSSTYKNYVQMIDESELSRLYPGYDAAKSDCEMQLYPIANYFVALNVSGFVLADGSPLNDELTYDIVLDTDHPSTYGAIVWYNPDTNSFVQQLAPNPQLGFTELSYTQKFERYIAPPAPDNNLHYLDNLGLQRFKANIDENLNEIKRTPVTTSGTGAAYVAQVKGINAANIYMVPVGTSFTMIPHTDSTTVKPTLNVNGLGAREIRVKSMVNNDAAIPTEDKFLLRDKPVDVMFDGTYWVCDMTVVDSRMLSDELGVDEAIKKAEDAASAASNAEVKADYNKTKIVKIGNDLPIMMRSGRSDIEVFDMNNGVMGIELHTKRDVANMFGMKLPEDGGDFDVNSCMCFVVNRDIKTYPGTINVISLFNSNNDTNTNPGVSAIVGDPFEVNFMPDFISVSYTYVYFAPVRTFAIFSNDNKSLNFYNRELYSLPEVGSVYDGMTVTNVFEVDLKSKYTPWSYVRDRVLSVVIKDKIQPLYLNEWFTYADKCVNIDISKLDMSNTISTYRMFDNCSSLKHVDFPDSDENKITDMTWMFRECSSLTSLDLSGFNTRNVIQMDGVFNGCSSLTSLDLSGFDTRNVINMSGMFGSCSSLTSLDLSGFDTRNVMSINGMFYGCSNLKSIFASQLFNIKSIKFDTDRMFSSCFMIVGGKGTVYDSAHTDKAYARIDNPPAEPGYFTELSTMINTLDRNQTFIDKIKSQIETDYYATLQLNLNEIESDADIVRDMPVYIEFNNSDINNPPQHEKFLCKVISISNEVIDIKILKFIESIAMPQAFVVMSHTPNNSGESCTMLFYNRAVAIPNSGDVFEDNLVNDAFPIDESGVFESPDDVPWSNYFSYHKAGNMSYVAYITFVDKVMPVSTAYWFYKIYMSSNITQANLANLDMSRTTNASHMFDCVYCDNNKYYIDVSGLDFSNVKNMNSMFANCGSRIILGENFNTSNANDMSHMFDNIKLPMNKISKFNFNTSNVTDMSYMFSNINDDIILAPSNNYSIDLSSFDTSNVVNMEMMFGYNKHLNNKAPQSGSSLSRIYVSNKFIVDNVENSKRMFYQCYSLFGGAGTHNNNEVIDKTYARIDNPPSAPGYFTDIKDIKQWEGGMLYLYNLSISSCTDSDGYSSDVSSHICDSSDYLNAKNLFMQNTYDCLLKIGFHPNDVDYVIDVTGVSVPFGTNMPVTISATHPIITPTEMAVSIIFNGAEFEPIPCKTKYGMVEFTVTDTYSYY